MARVNNFLENKGFLGTDMTHQRNWEKGGFVSNLISGGQNGYGFKAGSFDAATPLALPPAVIVVLQTPTMWDKITQDTEHVLPQTVKSMFECHAKSVSGIELSYTLETQDQPIGHDGQTFKVPTQSKRAEVSPSFTWHEVTGNLVWNIIRRWIWDINDPDTNAGLEFQETPDPFTMSTYALTFMAIQYDQTQHIDRMIDAAIYTNVFPQATGEFGMQRELGTTSVKERAVTFNGYVIHNERTRDLGHMIAELINLRGEHYLQASAAYEKVNEMFEEAGDLGNGTGIIDDKFLTTEQTNGVDDYYWAKSTQAAAPQSNAATNG